MKSLLFICLLSVLYGMAQGLVREYIFVSQQMNWFSAHVYCSQRYRNLASITTEEENQRAISVRGNTTAYTWIGLIRTAPHASTWWWIGGEQLNFIKWKPGEPNDWGLGENCSVITSSGWNDVSCQFKYPFLCCGRFTLVKENKTWEEAYKHCRSHYADLAFVDSEALLDLLETETKDAQTASVWTGLRFIDGKRFWVNRMLLGSLVSLPSCPAQPYRCGAYNFNTSVWENRDCNEEFNFLCNF